MDKLSCPSYKIVCSNTDKKSDNSYGTGFLVAPNTIVTVKHVITYQDTTPEGKTSVKIFDTITVYDDKCQAHEFSFSADEQGKTLALLRCKDDTFYCERSYRNLVRGHGNPVGSNVTVYGYLQECYTCDDYLFVNGQKAKSPENQDEFYNYSFTDKPRYHGGLSGSPVFYDDALIGILGYDIVRLESHPYIFGGFEFLKELKDLCIFIPSVESRGKLLVLAKHAYPITEDVFLDCIKNIDIYHDFEHEYSAAHGYFTIDEDGYLKLTDPAEDLLKKIEEISKKIESLESGTNKLARSMTAADLDEMKNRFDQARLKIEKMSLQTVSQTEESKPSSPFVVQLARDCIDSYDNYSKCLNVNQADLQKEFPDELCFFDSYMEKAVANGNDQEALQCCLTEAVKNLKAIYPNSIDWVSVFNAKYYHLFTQHISLSEDQAAANPIEAFLAYDPAQILECPGVDFPQRSILLSLIHLQNKRFQDAFDSAHIIEEKLALRKTNIYADALWLEGCAMEHIEEKEAPRYFLNALEARQYADNPNPTQLINALRYIARIEKHKESYSNALDYLEKVKKLQLDNGGLCIETCEEIIELCIEASVHYWVNEKKQLSDDFQNYAIKFLEETCQIFRDNAQFLVNIKTGAFLKYVQQLKQCLTKDNAKAYLDQIWTFANQLNVTTQWRNTIIAQEFLLELIESIIKSKSADRICTVDGANYLAVLLDAFGLQTHCADPNGISSQLLWDLQVFQSENTPWAVVDFRFISEFTTDTYTPREKDISAECVPYTVFCIRCVCGEDAIFQEYLKSHSDMVSSHIAENMAYDEAKLRDDNGFQVTRVFYSSPISPISVFYINVHTNQ